MPELPEVETTVRGLNKYVLNKEIKDIWTNYNSKYLPYLNTIKNAKYFEFFKEKTIGQKIIKIERHAKTILVHLNNNQIMHVHMKMTGHFIFGKYQFDKGVWVPQKGERKALFDPFNRHIRFVITFTDGHLVFCDMRKFATIKLINKDEYKNQFGPEPLEKSFTYKVFLNQILKINNKPIKTVLMNPEIISGIGNIYSDEILFASGVHPNSFSKCLNEENLKLIYSNIKYILKRGIDFGGDSMSDFRNLDGEKGEFQNKHMVYRRNKEKCFKCQNTIQRIVINTRSSHFCPKCQILFKD